MTFFHTSSTADTRATVFFDGSCPLCRAEIDGYRHALGSETLDFVDVSDDTSALPQGLNRAQAMRRFHVQDAQDRVFSGAAGFAALWARLARWRAVSRLVALPGLRLVHEGVYRLFLVLRPALIWVLRRLSPRRFQ